MRNVSTPEDLEAALADIFPAFSVDKSEYSESDPLTLHALFLFEFNPFFGKNYESFSLKQISALAELMDACSATPGNLENAIDTCFNEAGIGKHVRRLLRSP